MYIYIYYMSSKVTLYNTFNNSDCQSSFTVFNMKNSLIAFLESVISNIEFSICQCDFFFSDSYPVAHLSDLWHLNQWPWIKASVGQESDFPMPSCFESQTLFRDNRVILWLLVTQILLWQHQVVARFFNNKREAFNNVWLVFKGHECCWLLVREENSWRKWSLLWSSSWSHSIHSPNDAEIPD